MNFLQACSLLHENPERFRRFFDQNSLENPDIIQKIFIWDSSAKRPYYRMRGKPVAPEQAKEIILKGRGMSFNNFWNHEFSHVWGWCHPDGTIGINAWMTEKFPESVNLLEEFFGLACDFPFLDLCVAVTEMQELNYFDEYDLSSGQERRNYNYWEEPGRTSQECLHDWRKCTEIGIHLHDGMFSMLEKEEVLPLYDQYAAAYEPAFIQEDNPEHNPYDWEYYKYPENYQKLLQYDFLCQIIEK